MEAKSVRNMQSNIAVTNKHTAKLHHVGSLYILTYDARKFNYKIRTTTTEFFSMILYSYQVSCHTVIWLNSLKKKMPDRQRGDLSS